MGLPQRRFPLPPFLHSPFVILSWAEADLSLLSRSPQYEGFQGTFSLLLLSASSRGNNQFFPIPQSRASPTLFIPTLLAGLALPSFSFLSHPTLLLLSLSLCLYILPPITFSLSLLDSFISLLNCPFHLGVSFCFLLVLSKILSLSPLFFSRVERTAHGRGVPPDPFLTPLQSHFFLSLRFC